MNPIPLDLLLARSGATPAFRAAVADFARTGRPGPRLRVSPGAPPVKVERTLAKALVEYPALPVESIEVDAVSGCESFRGTLVLRTAEEERRVDFCWDCRWRAEQNGWTDWFGFPDQTRAAREYGWDCFREWEEVSATARVPAAAEPVPA